MQEYRSNFEARITEETRERYILALAVGLGVDEDRARANIDKLFALSEDLDSYDYIKSPDDPNKKGVAKIREVGTWFLPEKNSDNYSKGTGQDFAIGRWVLQLMREPLDSAVFGNLQADVKDLSFGHGADRFDEIMGKDF